jgi:hypothetical protein
VAPLQRGTIVRLDRLHQSGTIRADDGTEHPFERENMVLWLQFLELRPGDVVTFEVEGSANAINVERIS